MSPAKEQALWEFRAALHEAMTFIGSYAAMVQGMAEIGDDAGIAYSVRKQFAYMRQAIGICNDLHAAHQAIDSEAT